MFIKFHCHLRQWQPYSDEQTHSLLYTLFCFITCADMMLTMWPRWWPWHDNELTAVNLEKQSQKGNCKRFLEQTKTDINSAIRETAGRITRGRATGLKNNERAENGEKTPSRPADHSILSSGLGPVRLRTWTVRMDLNSKLLKQCIAKS